MLAPMPSSLRKRAPESVVVRVALAQAAMAASGGAARADCAAGASYSATSASSTPIAQRRLQFATSAPTAATSVRRQNAVLAAASSRKMIARLQQATRPAKAKLVTSAAHCARLTQSTARSRPATVTARLAPTRHAFRGPSYVPSDRAQRIERSVNTDCACSTAVERGSDRPLTVGGPVRCEGVAQHELGEFSARRKAPFCFL
jgi:hypothetical protein